MTQQPLQDFCFIHAADLHLDTPFTGIKKLSPQIAKLLSDATLLAFDNLIKLTIDSHAKFLLLAGDIYDGITRGVRAQLHFASRLERLSALGIKVFIVHGNHDPLTGWSAIKKFPDNVTIFSDEEVQEIPIIEKEQILATIYGISYKTKETKENLSLRFKRNTNQGLHIGLLHANLDSSINNTDNERLYAPTTKALLIDSGMDYWALGHIHTRQIIEQNPWICYPGNLQGLSTKQSELGAKGALLVQVNANRITNVTFSPCDVVRFIALDSDISNCQDIQEVRLKLLAQIEELSLENKEKTLILSISLSGKLEQENSVYQALKKHDATSDLRETLNNEINNNSSSLFLESISDNTQNLIDLEDIKLRSDFSAELLSLAEESSQNNYQAITDKLEKTISLKLLHKIPELKQNLANSEIFNQAIKLALNLLEEEVI